MKLDGSMIIGIKDSLKLIGISIVACCAVFVCTLFLSYNIDLSAIKSQITTEPAKIMYNAQVLSGKVTAGVSGGCLVLTSVVMLLFHVKNYIDTHGKELGILKALGYSNFKIAINFCVFGLSVLVGCICGFVLAYLYLPNFYLAQNHEQMFPEITPHFHFLLTTLLVVAPSVVFALLAVLFAGIKLKNPVLDLLKEKRTDKVKTSKRESKDIPFLLDLRKNTVKSKKTLVFFVAFSAFCFSAMVQMSVSMNDLTSETFAVMIITIGLILAYTTLFLSLSSVVKQNSKTIAMMRVFGYGHRQSSNAILGGYRIFAYIGFAIGTLYQYLLLKIMVTVVFADVENVPEYKFDFVACAITLVMFVITYELAMLYYSYRIKKVSIKSIMLE